MARVKRGVTAHAKHKKVLEQAKGFYGRRKNTIRTAKAAVDKAGQYAYRDRKVRKRAFRSLWIQRINAGARIEGFTYSQFIHGLDVAGIDMELGEGAHVDRSQLLWMAAIHLVFVVSGVLLALMDWLNTKSDAH